MIFRVPRWARIAPRVRGPLPAEVHVAPVRGACIVARLPRGCDAPARQAARRAAGATLLAPMTHASCQRHPSPGGGDLQHVGNLRGLCPRARVPSTHVVRGPRLPARVDCASRERSSHRRAGRIPQTILSLRRLTCRAGGRDAHPCAISLSHLRALRGPHTICAWHPQAAPPVRPTAPSAGARQYDQFRNVTDV